MSLAKVTFSTSMKVRRYGLCGCVAGQEVTDLQFPPDRHTKQSLTQTNHTR
jgi:hypothetical protein